jgi:hypothetical protein
VLSSEIDRNLMSGSSNGFSFPVTAALGAHSQAPPTLTMASPPTLPVGKHQSSVGPSVPVTSAESAPWSVSCQVRELVFTLKCCCFCLLNKITTTISYQVGAAMKKCHLFSSVYVRERLLGLEHAIFWFHLST